MKIKVLLATLAAGTVACFFSLIMFGVLFLDLFANIDPMDGKLIKNPPDILKIFGIVACGLIAMRYDLFKTATVKVTVCDRKRNNCSHEYPERCWS